MAGRFDHAWREFWWSLTFYQRQFFIGLAMLAVYLLVRGVLWLLGVVNRF